MPNPLSSAVSKSRHALDELIERLAGIKTAAPRTHAGVRFDPRGGLGETPDAANLDYRGFQAYMRPSEFLGLNPPRSHSNEFVAQAIEQGQPISVPMLYVNRVPKHGWQVVGHEGRGRMMALAARSPDSLFPVGVHPFGEIRARDIRPEMLWEQIVPERGSVGPVVLPRAAILGNSMHVNPAAIDDETVIRALLELAGE